jgi:hypothetical protein
VLYCIAQCLGVGSPKVCEFNSTNGDRKLIHAKVENYFHD